MFTDGEMVSVVSYGDTITTLSACVEVDAEGRHFEHYLIATLKITMSKWQHCKFDNWR